MATRVSSTCSLCFTALNIVGIPPDSLPSTLVNPSLSFIRENQEKVQQYLYSNRHQELKALKKIVHQAGAAMRSRPVFTCIACSMDRTSPDHRRIHHTTTPASARLELWHDFGQCECQLEHDLHSKR
ncbi:hypothetical protein AAFF_G00213490 [Aldrovandia affinis]|uniref:Uncharacterized protein n=1 Tax=Aldrovandia affinis TaxID=143900 RepID=A0AAD7RJF5_9TELE|nr:hypothetical protein AAFF_G00213490 [Aldrovandia affinis]